MLYLLLIFCSWSVQKKNRIFDFCHCLELVFLVRVEEQNLFKLTFLRPLQESFLCRPIRIDIF